MNNILTVTASVLDLTTFEDVRVVKQAEFSPVTSVEEALARLANNTEKLLAVINDGLKEEARESLKSDTSKPWRTFKTDDDGEELDELNGEFTGKMAKDPKAVNAFVLNMAKTMYGFEKGAPIEKKREAKEKARNFIKSNPEIMGALANQ